MGIGSRDFEGIGGGAFLKVREEGCHNARVRDGGGGRVKLSSLIGVKAGS